MSRLKTHLFARTVGATLAVAQRVVAYRFAETIWTPAHRTPAHRATARVAPTVAICLLLFLSQKALAQPCPPANPVVVTTTSNAAGQTNLQWACNCINTVPVLNLITFNIPGAGPHTIQPNVAFPIPVLTKNLLHIDGTTDNIVLDGAVAGNVPGLDVNASEATIEGLDIQNFQQAGIQIRLGSNHLVESNELNNNQFGVNALGNVQSMTATQNVIENNLMHGIFLQGSTTSATISTNGISGNNGSGVFAPGIGNVLVTNSNFWCNLENGITRGGAPAPPVILQASNLQISGTSPPNAAIQVFVEDNSTCSSAPCQGRFFVGNATATAVGTWTLSLSPGDVTPGEVVAATATLGNVNTSEFSACATVVLDCSTLNTTATGDPVSCFGGANGSATANPTGGTPPFTFAWDNGGNTQTINNLSAGVYFVTVTDALTCFATASANVTQPASAPNVSVAETDVLCFGGSTGTITLTPSGGTPGYTFDWADLPGTNNPQNRTNLPAGNYFVTMSDANACTDTASANIAQPSQISPSTAVGNVACNGGATGSINLSVSGGTPLYTFDWADLPGTNNPEDRSNLPAGTYSVTISDANACTATASATVTQPTAISPSTDVTNVACGGGATGAIDLSVSGGTQPYTFDWADLPGTNNPEDRTNLATGTYSVTITDAATGGCTATASATVNQNSTLNLSGTTTPVLCNGDANASINLTTGGGAAPFTFDWSDLAGANNPEDRSNLPAGTYSVTVTDASACTADSTFTLDDPPGLTAGGLIANILCNGDANGGINLVTNGGTFPYTFDWADIPGDDDPEDRGGLAAGLYSFTVTDANGCTTFGGSFINEPPPLVLVINATGESSPGAGDGSAVADPSGGTPPYNFLWSNGATSQQISNLSPGDYSLTITDFNGCTIADTIALPLAGCDLSVSILATAAACFQSATGSLSATAIGNMPPFDFLWNNGESTPTIDSLPAGQYFVTVTDAASCTATATATVGQPGALPLPVYAVFAPDTVCGNTTFTLEADDLFQSAAVAYAWRLPTGDTLPTIEPFLEVTALSTAFSGEYFVARDSAGCRSIWVGGAPVEVVSLPPGAAFAGNDTLLCNPAQIQLAALPPPVGNGEWHSLSGDDISQPNSSTTTAQISEAGEHAFVWQVAVAACPQAATDTVTYFVEAPPILQDDAWTLKRAHDELVMNVLLNDNLKGLQDTVLTQLDAPVSGDLEFLPGERLFRYAAAEGFRGTVQFHYVVCNPLATCGVGCDTALVTIEVLNLPTVPEALVIDDPGLNGLLIISGIQGLRVELSIFNRWGDLVYEEKEYSNDNPWKGRFQRTGQVLPHGAYFFYLNAFEKDEPLGETQTGVIHLFGK